jgi:hypothetical protein
VLNHHRPCLLVLLRDLGGQAIAIESRDCLARLGAERVEATERDDNPTRDVTEIPIGPCAGRSKQAMAWSHHPLEEWAPWAFWFVLHPIPQPRQVTRRQGGEQRSASCWMVRLPRAQLDAYRTAVDASWRWQWPHANKRAARHIGFPRPERKGRDLDWVTLSTRAMCLAPDRRQVLLSRVASVWTFGGSIHRLERLASTEGMRVPAATVRQVPSRAIVALRKGWQRAKLEVYLTTSWRDVLRRLATRGATTHGRTVARARRCRGCASRGTIHVQAWRWSRPGAALPRSCRELGSNAAWHGSELVGTGRFLPTSKACPGREDVQEQGWEEQWRYGRCGKHQQRDVHAVIDLARRRATPPSSLGRGAQVEGSVGIFVRRRSPYSPAELGGAMGNGPRPHGQAQVVGGA